MTRCVAVPVAIAYTAVRVVTSWLAVAGSTFSSVVAATTPASGVPVATAFVAANASFEYDTKKGRFGGHGRNWSLTLPVLIRKAPTEVGAFLRSYASSQQGEYLVALVGRSTQTFEEGRDRMAALITRHRTGAALLALMLSLGGPACVFQTEDDAEVEPVEEEDDADVETEVEVEDEATP